MFLMLVMHYYTSLAIPFILIVSYMSLIYFTHFLYVSLHVIMVNIYNFA